MGKHTEGPWEIERPCGFPYTGIFIVSPAANDRRAYHSFVVEVRQHRALDEESEANARLIAAAPTMLEAPDG